MNALLIQWLIVLLLWVGGWGIIELLVDEFAKDSRRLRFLSYLGILLVGIFFVLIIEIYFPSDAPSD